MEAVEDDDVEVEVADVDDDPPVRDADEDEDLELDPEVADVEFEKLNVVAVRELVISRWDKQKFHSHLAGVDAAFAQRIKENRKVIRLLLNTILNAITTVFEQNERSLIRKYFHPCGCLR